MADSTQRQKDIDAVAQIASDHLLQTWLIIDRMLPEHLEPIRNGLKRRGGRSKKGPGLTSNFMMFLCAAGILHRDGSLTMGELSRATSIPQSSSTRMVDWMVENGYVERFQDADDRRIVRIRLTDEGLELLLAAKAQLRELAARFIKRLPAIQRAAVIMSLSDLISAWQSVQEEQSTASPSSEKGSD